MQPDIKKNYIFRLIYELICFGVPLVTTPYVSRVLGAEGVGVYSFTYSVIAWFMMLVILGNATYGIREISRKRDDAKEYSALFWEIQILSIISLCICLVIWGGITVAVPVYRSYFLALTPFLIGQMFDISWFYTGLERLGVIVMTAGVIKVIGMAFIFLMIKSPGDVALYCLVTGMTYLLSNLAMWLLLPKYLVKSRISTDTLKGHFKNTLIYFVPTFATSAYLILDKTLIGVITKDHFENGYYEQATRIIVVAKAFSFVVLNTVVSARMSYLFSKSGDEKLKGGIRQSMDAIMFMGYGCVFGLIGVSHILVPVFFGEEFLPVETLIYLMLPLIPVIGISNCLENQYYIPVGKRAMSARYVVYGAMANLVLNVCFIYLWGARGSAIANVIAELFLTVLFMANCNGFLKTKDIVYYSSKRVVAGIIMALIVRAMSNIPIKPLYILLLQIPAGVFIYVLILLILKDSFTKKLLTRRLL